MKNTSPLTTNQSRKEETTNFNFNSTVTKKRNPNIATLDNDNEYSNQIYSYTPISYLQSSQLYNKRQYHNLATNNSDYSSHNIKRPTTTSEDRHSRSHSRSKSNVKQHILMKSENHNKASRKQIGNIIQNLKLMEHI